MNCVRYLSEIYQNEICVIIMSEKISKCLKCISEVKIVSENCHLSIWKTVRYVSENFCTSSCFESSIAQSMMIITLTLGAALIGATNAGLSLGPCGPKPPTAEEFSVDRVGN